MQLTKASATSSHLSNRRAPANSNLACSVSRVGTATGVQCSSSFAPFLSTSTSTSLAHSFISTRQRIGARSAQVCKVALSGKLISQTEVPAFIPRDDFVDQLYSWAKIEAGESGQRNFGMPMKVEPRYVDGTLWGFNIEIFKEGVKRTDIGCQFDELSTQKHEWVGRGADGFPQLEGKVDIVKGKFFELWKLDEIPVDEDLRSTIRALCTGLVSALNRYYAFGSVFVDDAQ